MPHARAPWSLQPVSHTRQQTLGKRWRQERPRRTAQRSHANGASARTFVLTSSYTRRNTIKQTYLNDHSKSSVTRNVASFGDWPVIETSRVVVCFANTNRENKAQILITVPLSTLLIDCSTTKAVPKVEPVEQNQQQVNVCWREQSARHGPKRYN